MEAEKVTYVEAEVIESKPLPLMHWGEVALVSAGFVVGYLIGRKKAKKKTGNRKLATRN